MPSENSISKYPGSTARTLVLVLYLCRKTSYFRRYAKPALRTLRFSIKPKYFTWCRIKTSSKLPGKIWNRPWSPEPVPDRQPSFSLTSSEWGAGQPSPNFNHASGPGGPRALEEAATIVHDKENQAGMPAAALPPTGVAVLSLGCNPKRWVGGGRVGDPC